MHHAHCGVHLEENSRREHGPEAAEAFKAMMYTTEKTMFDKLLELKTRGTEYFSNIDYTWWANYAFPQSRYGLISSTAVEAYINGSCLIDRNPSYSCSMESTVS